MKRCPTCRRDYFDDSLLYCLDDGTALLEGPSSGGGTETAILSSKPADDHPSGPDAQTRAQLHTTGSTSVLPTATRASTGKIVVVTALILLAIGGIGFAISRYWPRRSDDASSGPLKMTRLTTTGKASNVAISPDGRYVVHVQDDGGQQSLWIRQTVTQSNVQIAPPAQVTYDSLVFSPDGNFIYYSVSGQQYPQRVLFQIPTLGGAPKKILENLDADALSFSPDGKQFAFIRTQRGSNSSVMIANPDGSDEKKLVEHKNPPEVLGSPAWSPDGQRIAYDVLNYESNDSTLYEATVKDGSTKPLTSQRWFRIASLKWTSDGGALLMLAPAEQKFAYQVWQVSYPNAEARQITNDLDDYEQISVTADSKTIALVKQTAESNVWVAPMANVDHAAAITSGAGKSDSYVSWSPDANKIVYGSDATGNDDIWTVNADGTDQKQLTQSARVNRHPAVSPDGRTIVFLSDRSGGPHLWKMNIDGSDQRQITNGAMGEQAPTFSPDGHWIFYSTAQDRFRTTWKIPADGSGPPVRITDKFASFPGISPDGGSVAMFCKDDQSSPFRLCIATLDGAVNKEFDLPPTFDHPLHWTTDGKGVAYIDTRNGVSNIVVQPIDGGATKPLTNFKADRILWFDISRDGKELALARGTINHDVVLISNFRSNK